MSAVVISRAAMVGALVALASPVLAHGPAVKPVPTATAVAPEARGAAASVDAFHAALRRGDTKAAVALLADDVLIFESGEVERSKTEYAGHHLGADAAFAAAVPSMLTRRSGQSNGAMAWVASEGKTSGTYKGKPIDLATTETMVLRRVGKGWRIVQIHWSSAKSR